MKLVPKLKQISVNYIQILMILINEIYPDVETESWTNGHSLPDSQGERLLKLPVGMQVTKCCKVF